MELSIENVKQLAEALEARNKGYKVDIKSMITEQLTGVPATATDTVITPSIIDSSTFISGDSTSGEKLFYFGVLTVGNNVDHAKLFVGSDEIIEIQSNSQIIDFFTDAKYYDSLNVELTAPQGHFRGYQLILNQI